MSTSDNITIQQAIDAMQNIIDYFCTRPTERAAAELAIIALKEKQERETPKALTKEQIMKIEMNSKFIYIQTIYNGKPTGTVICVLWNKKNSVFKMKDYGVTWRAFYEMPKLTEKF